MPNTSTGFCVAAGAFPLADMILGDWDGARALKITVGATLAAVVSAGLDHVVPGLGTGLAAILVLGAFLTYAPTIAKKL